MSKYEVEVKKLDKVISDLEARLSAGFDPAFSEMLKHFMALREKYLRLSNAGPSLRYSDKSKPYWGSSPPDGR